MSGRLFAGSLVAALAVAELIGTRTAARSRAPVPTRHVIEIREMAFHPREVHAAPGDTLVWINRDLFPHTATEADSAWTSPPLAPGERWSWVADGSPMTDYLCVFHPMMEGRVITEDPHEERKRP